MQMQSSETCKQQWRQCAKDLESDLTKKDIQLKDLASYLAAQTTDCKHTPGCIRGFAPLFTPQPPILTMF